MINTILEGISPYLWQMLGVILTAVASYVGLKLKILYEKKINTETKKQIVKTVVEMVEQIAKNKGWNGEEKLAKAKETICDLINQSGLKITELELEVLIESAVNGFNQGIKN